MNVLIWPFALKVYAEPDVRYGEAKPTFVLRRDRRRAQLDLRFDRPTRADNYRKIRTRIDYYQRAQLNRQEPMSTVVNRVGLVGVAIVGILGWTGNVRAATILNPLGLSPTELTVSAFRGTNNATDTLFPTGLPYTNSHFVTNVDEESSGSYDLSGDRFKVNFDQIGNSARIGTGGKTRADGVRFSAGIQFSVDIDTPYTITGHYDVTGDRNKWLWVQLRDSFGGKSFSNLQESNPGPTVQNFVLGETAGTANNELIGSMTGMLNAGWLYTLSINAEFYNQVNIDPPATGVGSGTVTLYLGDIALVPLPPAIFFLASGLVGLMFRRRVS